VPLAPYCSLQSPQLNPSLYPPKKKKKTIVPTSPLLTTSPTRTSVRQYNNRHISGKYLLQTARFSLLSWHPLSSLCLLASRTPLCSYPLHYTKPILSLSAKISIRKGGYNFPLGGSYFAPCVGSIASTLLAPPTSPNDCKEPYYSQYNSPFLFYFLLSLPFPFMLYNRRERVIY